MLVVTRAQEFHILKRMDTNREKNKKQETPNHVQKQREPSINQLALAHAMDILC